MDRISSPRTWLYVASMAHGLTHSMISVGAAIIFLIKIDLGLTYLEMGTLIGTAGLMFGVGAIPSGILADRFGPRETLAGGFLFGALASLTFFFAYSFDQLLVGFFLWGSAAGLYHPAGLNLVSRLYGSEKELGDALATHGMLGNLGEGSTPFLGAILAVGLNNWRLAYVVIGGLCFFFGSFFLLFKDKKIEGNYTNLSEENSRERTLIAEVVKNYKELLILPMILIALLVTFMRGTTYQGLQPFLSTYFAENRSLIQPFLEVLEAIFSPVLGPNPGPNETSFLVSAFLLTILYWSGIPGQKFGGVLNARYGSTKGVAIATFLAGIAILSLVLLPGIFLLLGIIMVGFVFYSGQAPVNSFIAKGSREELRGTAYSVTFLTRFGIASAVSPLVGFLSDTTSLQFSFLVLACIAFITSSLYFVMKKAEEAQDTNLHAKIETSKA